MALVLPLQDTQALHSGQQHSWEGEDAQTTEVKGFVPSFRAGRMLRHRAPTHSPHPAFPPQKGSDFPGDSSGLTAPQPFCTQEQQRWKGKCLVLHSPG